MNDTSVIPSLVTGSVTPVKKRGKHRNRCIIPVACVAACMIAFNAGIALLLIQSQKPVTVAFDMKGTIDQFMNQTAQHQLTEQQSAALSERFTHALETSIADYQRRRHAIILVSPSVVAGAEDITGAIQRDISHHMREGDK